MTTGAITSCGTRAVRTWALAALYTFARRAGLLLLASVSVTACTKDEPAVIRPAYEAVTAEGGVRRLTLGIHPLHNPGRLLELYGPIIDAVNGVLGDVEIRIEASRDYADYERKLHAASLDLAMPNPYQTVTAAAQRYAVFGKVSRDDDFHGLILLRKDSTVRGPLDLRGARFSCPARTALAACMLPLLYLYDAGLDVAGELDVRAVGSQESSILNVARGLVDAGATWPPPWRAFQKEHPDLAAQLKVAWTTPGLPNNSLMARRDIDPQLLARVAAALFGLSASDAGRSLLGRAEIAGFEPADESSYVPVQDMLRRYRAAIEGDTP